MPEISLLIRYWSFITFSFFIWNFEHSCIATIWNIFSNITKSHSLNICISFWARIKSGNSGHILKSHGNYKKPVKFFLCFVFLRRKLAEFEDFEHPTFAKKDLSEWGVSQEGLTWCNRFPGSFLELSSCQGFIFSPQMLLSHSALFCTLII